MRSGKGILLAAILVLTGSMVANAALYFSPDQSTIYGMAKTWDSDYMDGTTSTEPVKTIINGDTVRFQADMQYGDGTGDGWASMGIGYEWPPPAGLQDLSGYDGYTLSFLNTNNSSWFVNLYMNTGWTDPPYDESNNNFYENGWVELLPGVSTSITLVFSDEGVINLNQVTNIGFEIGANLDEYPYNPDADNPSNPDTYHIDVTQIPEPLMLTLLALGGLLLRRKR